MTRPLIQIGDEVREMTDAELAQWEQDANDASSIKKAQAAKQKAAASGRAKLADLGLTEAEIAALLGA